MSGSQISLAGTCRRPRMRRLSIVANVIGAGLMLAAAAHADPYNPGERALGGGLLGAGTGAVIGAIAGGGRGAGIGAAGRGGARPRARAATPPGPPRSAVRPPLPLRAYPEYLNS